MKFTLFFFIAATLSLSDSNYKQVKIDMHGGEYDSNYDRTYNSFSSSSFGRFVEDNSTKSR